MGCPGDVPGLFFLQQCKRTWQASESQSFAAGDSVCATDMHLIEGVRIQEAASTTAERPK